MKLDNNRVVRRNQSHILKTEPMDIPLQMGTSPPQMGTTLQVGTPLRTQSSFPHTEMETTTRSGRVSKASSYLGDYGTWKFTVVLLMKLYLMEH